MKNFLNHIKRAFSSHKKIVSENVGKAVATLELDDGSVFTIKATGFIFDWSSCYRGHYTVTTAKKLLIKQLEKEVFIETLESKLINRQSIRSVNIQETECIETCEIYE